MSHSIPRRIACGAIVGAAVVALLMPAMGRGVPVAHACVVSDGFNPADDSEVVIGGRVTGWRARPDIPVVGLNLPTIEIVIAVEQRFKGTAPSQVLMFEPADTSASPRWVVTSCGTFYGDPTGKYVILGLARDDEGRLRAGSPRLFFIGDHAEGQAYGAALDRLRTYGIQPPATGSAGLARTY